MIDISQIDKAAVLAALSHPQGFGYRHYQPEDMTHEQRVLAALRMQEATK